MFYTLIFSTAYINDTGKVFFKQLNYEESLLAFNTWRARCVQVEQNEIKLILLSQLTQNLAREDGFMKLNRSGHVCFHVEQNKFAENELSFIFQEGFGNALVRWYAKEIDHSTPLFNDTVHYRQEYAYYQNLTNTYRSSLYDTKYVSYFLV